MADLTERTGSSAVALLQSYLKVAGSIPTGDIVLLFDFYFWAQRPVCSNPQT
jgi:hypothetical protein